MTGTETDPVQAPTRIMLVDDQALLRMGFRMVLEAEDDFTVVAEAGDGAAAVRLADSMQPDVILMDVRMPGVDGIEATRLITAAHPETRIIILTTFDLDEYAFGGLKAGARGFLLKDAQPSELTTAIRAVASGEASVSPRVTRRMLELFGSKLPAAEAGGGSGTGDADEADAASIDVLTDREREVFFAIAEGLSNTELAERFFLSESTVKTHVGRILQKLGLRDRVHIVILAYEQGHARP
jgi:DNA-binding NarL/FixJ family response regulator